jgi:hypothetical protein
VDGMRNGAAFDVRNKTHNGRDQVGVGWSAQYNDHLGWAIANLKVS